MTITKYNIEINTKAVQENLSRILSQVFKLLPMREEKKDWQKPLETLTIELLGMGNLLSDHKDLLSCASKLEGLLVKEEVDFSLYRRTIFECCSLLDKIKNNV
jgi:hypothetical protein